MIALFARVSLGLLRVAANAIFCFEFNRLLGRATKGSITHRQRQLPYVEASLLAHVAAPVTSMHVTLPSGIRIHTIVAGRAAARILATACSSPTSTSTSTSTSASSGDDRSRQHDKYCHIYDDGDMNPIVLFHGHSMGGVTFYRNVDDLLRLGFTSVYMPDLPGFGRSSRVVFNRCADKVSRQQADDQEEENKDEDSEEKRDEANADKAIDYFATPMLHWLRQLRFKRFTLGGHSLGAYIAHEVTTRLASSLSSSSLKLRKPKNGASEHDNDDANHPSPTVTKLILIAPAAIRRPTRLRTALWFSLTPQRVLTSGGLLAQLLFASKYPSSPAYNEPGMRRFALLSNSISHRTGDAAAAAILSFSFSLSSRCHAECVRPLLERATPLHGCAVHLVAGCEDPLVPVAALRELYAALVKSGNDVALSVVSRADHAPHIVKPRAFASAVRRVDVSRSVVRRRLSKLGLEQNGCGKWNDRRWGSEPIAAERRSMSMPLPMPLPMSVPVSASGLVGEKEHRQC